MSASCASASRGRDPFAPSSIETRRARRSRATRRRARNRPAIEAAKDDVVVSDVPPRKFTVREGEFGKVLSAAIPLLLRLGTGALIGGYDVSLAEDDGGSRYSLARFAGRRVAERSKTLPETRPSEPITLYEYEGSPYCKKVREACSVLDLDVLFKPCPRGSDAFRAEAEALGAVTFPFTVDPNAGVAMGESDDIIDHLFKKYGGETHVPFLLKRDGVLTNATAYAAAVARLKALRARPASKQPEKPLELDVRDFSVLKTRPRVSHRVVHSAHSSVLPPGIEQERRLIREHESLPSAVFDRSEHRCSHV